MGRVDQAGETHFPGVGEGGSPAGWPTKSERAHESPLRAATEPARGGERGASPPPRRPCSVDYPLPLHALDHSAALDDAALEALVLWRHAKQQRDGQAHVQHLVHAAAGEWGEAGRGTGALAGKGRARADIAEWPGASGTGKARMQAG